MKRHYVVLLTNGYYLAGSKKEAMAYYQKHDTAIDVIRTRSERGNYYHNRIKSILD